MKYYSLALIVLTLVSSCNFPNIQKMKDDAENSAKKAEKDKLLTPDENELFDANQVDPVALLIQMYKEKRILLLGHAGHETYEHLYFLEKLLEKIGTDPKLKYVILERPADNNPLYEQLSKHDIHEVLGTYQFKSQVSKDQSLCFSEWAYGIKNFMNIVKAINIQRHPENQLDVRAIDSVDSNKEFSWPGIGKEINDGSCISSSIQNPDLPSSVTFSMFQPSGNREIQTAQNFEEVYKSLKNDEKVIVLYHHAHLVRGFTSCFPFMLQDETWGTQLTPMTWMDHFTNKHPNAAKDTGLILFDNSKDNNYRFSSRQMLRQNKQTVGIALKPFKNVLKEKGLENWEPTAMLAKYHNGQHRSDKTLPDLSDGLILIKEGLLNFRLSEDPSQYLQEHCSPVSDGSEIEL